MESMINGLGEIYDTLGCGNTEENKFLFSNEIS